MVLYIDTYITDSALHSAREDFKPVLKILENIRSCNSNYKFQKKKDIFKFTLASYSEYVWDEAIINISGESVDDIRELNEYIDDIFLHPKCSLERSSKKDDWVKNIEKIQGNPWVFFSPNNDHPIVHNDFVDFDQYISVADKYEHKYPHKIVSILYSHFPEFWNSIYPYRNLYSSSKFNIKVVENNKKYYVVELSQTPLDSLFIHKKNNLLKFFNSAKIDKKIVRLEDINDEIYFPCKNIVVVPKIEICRHYDSYVHTLNDDINKYVSEYSVPVLFIPPGFFEKTINVRYGFNDYDTLSLNCNPFSENYSFENKQNGTDLKLYYSEIPFFIKKRVSRIHTNSNLIYHGKSFANLLIYNPWKSKNIIVNIRRIIRNLILNISTFLYGHIRKIYRFLKILVK